VLFKRFPISMSRTLAIIKVDTGIPAGGFFTHAITNEQTAQENGSGRLHRQALDHFCEQLW